MKRLQPFTPVARRHTRLAHPRRFVHVPTRSYIPTSARRDIELTVSLSQVTVQDHESGEVSATARSCERSAGRGLTGVCHKGHANGGVQTACGGLCQQPYFVATPFFRHCWRAACEKYPIAAAGQPNLT